MASRFNASDSAVNTAILSSIFDLTNAQKVLAGAVFGFTKKFGFVDTSSGKKADKDQKETLKLLNETATNISKRMEELEAERKKSEKDQKNSVLENLANISEVFGNDEKKSKRFTDTVTALDKFIQNTNRASTARAVFGSLVELNESIDKLDLTRVGKGLLAVAGGLTAIGGAFFIIGKTVSVGSVLGATAILGLVLGFAYKLTQLDQARLDTGTTSMIRLAGTMLLMTGSVALLSMLSFESAMKGILIFTMLTATIVATNMAINRFGTTRISGVFASAGIAIIASSIGILGLGIATFNKLVPDPKKALMPILVVSGFVMLMTLINKIPSRSGRESGIVEASKGLLFASASIAVLAASIMVWDMIQPRQVLVPILAITGLALGLALMNKIGGKNGDIKTSAIGLMIASVSIAVLAGSIYLWDYLGIDTDMIALPAMAILGLMGGLALVAKMGGAQVLMASGALILTGIAIGVVALGIKQWEGISDDTTLNMAVVLTEITLMLITLGGAGVMTLAGAGALLIAGGAIWVVGKGLQEMDKVSGESMGASMLFLTGLGAGLALLGLAPWAILGAGALALGGYALIKVGQGLQEMNKAKMTKQQYEVMTTGLISLAGVFESLGGLIKTPLILAGAYAMDKVGEATLKIAKTLKIVSEAKLTDQQIIGIGGSLKLFINSMLTVFDDFDGSYRKVRRGINALAGLGNMIANLAYGLVQMGRLTFVEYEVKDGELVAKTARPFTETDFNNVGVGIGKVISALTTPLENVGKSAGMFSSGNVGRGVKALTGLGNLVKGLVDGIVGMASLQFTTYDIVDGKLVPVSTTTFSQEHATRVGVNISTVIGALTSPLEKIGKDAGWLYNSDVERGVSALKNLTNNVVSPIKTLIEFMNTQKIDASSATQTAIAFQILLGGITSGVTKLADSDMDDLNDDFGTFVENVKNLTSNNGELNRTRNNFERIGRSLVNINNELTNEKLNRILSLKEAITEMSSQKLYDNMSSVITLMEQKLAPLFVQMNQLLQENNNYLMNGGMNAPMYDPNNPLMGGFGSTMQNGSQFSMGGDAQSQMNPLAQPATAEDINQAIGKLEQTMMQMIIQMKKK